MSVRTRARVQTDLDPNTFTETVLYKWVTLRSVDTPRVRTISYLHVPSKSACRTMEPAIPVRKTSGSVIAGGRSYSSLPAGGGEDGFSGEDEAKTRLRPRGRTRARVACTARLKQTKVWYYTHGHGSRAYYYFVRITPSRECSCTGCLCVFRTGICSAYTRVTPFRQKRDVLIWFYISAVTAPLGTGSGPKTCRLVLRAARCSQLPRNTLYICTVSHGRRRLLLLKTCTRVRGVHSGDRLFSLCPAVCMCVVLYCIRAKSQRATYT